MIAWLWRFLLRWRMRFLYFSAVLTMLALGLMCWSVLDPTPFPVIAAMSMGQVLGTGAFAMFGAVIFLDLWKAKIPHEEQKAKAEAAKQKEAEDAGGQKEAKG
jgi:hypothetical protein